MCKKVNLSFEWKRVTKTVAHFRMIVGADVFDFDATDLNDSVGELARATALAALDGKIARVTFENEPGEHILELNPLGDGRVDLMLYWDANSYGLFKERQTAAKMFSGRVDGDALVSAVLLVLGAVKEKCRKGGVTVGKYRFPDEEFGRLRNSS